MRCRYRSFLAKADGKDPDHPEAASGAGNKANFMALIYLIGSPAGSLLD